MSVREAAARIGVPETTYREWEYGRAIQGEPYPAIARTFGVSLSQLLLGQDSGEQDIAREIEDIQERLAQLKECLLLRF